MSDAPKDETGQEQIMPEAGDDAPLDSFTEKLGAFRTLLTSDPESADEFLESLGGAFSEAEQAIVAQMADGRVLAQPERFERANRQAVKGIEVLYRNGRRPAPISGWGPLRPIVRFLQVYVTSYITRSYVMSVMRNMLELYTARENQAKKGSNEWHALYYARWNLDKMDARYQGDRGSIPLLIAGGTVLAGLATALGEVVTTIITRDVLLVIFALVMLAVLAAIGSGIVQSAGIAKRRIAMTVEQPLDTLYDVVGNAGIPPRDNAWVFALGAIATLILLWLILPGVFIGVLFN